MVEDDFEYGIQWVKSGDVHRTGMTFAEVEQWLFEWEIEGGRPGVFRAIARKIGEWEPVA